MKILQSCGSRSWGGLEMQALLVSRELLRRGHEVSLLCIPRTTLLKAAYEAGVPSVGLLGKDKQAFSTIKDLSRLLKGYSYDVVHTHLSHDLWWLVPAMKLSSSNAKLFLTKHMASGVKKTDPLHRFLYGRLQGTFAISDYIRESVLNTCPVPENEVHVLHPGIAMEDFDCGLFDREETRAELGASNETVLVGMCGRLSPGKGHEEFLQAARLLADAGEVDMRFVIIGDAIREEESYEWKVKALAADLEIGELTKFTGFRKDVPRLLSALDILAFPSHEESFGLTLVEAMALKVPVVASGNAGVLDIVVDGETGYLVLPKDHIALAGGIRKLAVDPALRRRFGNSGRKRAEEFFSIKGMIEKLEHYYSETPLRD